MRQQVWSTVNRSSITVDNVAKNSLRRVISPNIKGQYMKESNTLAGNGVKNFLRREMLRNTKGQYMKESDTLVGNAANNFQWRELLLYINGQYMKESNTRVGNVINNFLQRQVLPDTIELYIRKIEHDYKEGRNEFCLFQIGRGGKDKGLGCATCIKSGDQSLLHTDANISS